MKPGRIGIILAVFLLGTSLLVSQLIRVRNEERRQMLRTYVASLAAQHIRSFLSERAADLRYIGRQWHPTPEGRAAVTKAIHSIFENHLEYHCIKLLDPRGVVIEGDSHSQDGVGIGATAFTTEAREQFFKRALQSKGAILLSDILPLRTGVPGLLLAQGIPGKGGAGGGCLYEALSLQSLLDICLDPDFGPHYTPRLSFHEKAEAPPDNTFARNSFQIFDRAVEVDMVPNDPNWPDEGLNVPILILGGGVALSLLVGFLAWRLERAQTRARDAGAHLQAVFETSYDFLWSCDGSGKVSFVSPKLTTLLGYRPQEVLGRPVSELFPPESAAGLPDMLQRLRRGETIRDDLRRIERIGGGRVLLESTLVPTMDARGRLLRIDGASRDVTDRRETEERYRRIIETSEDLILEAGADGAVKYANHAFSQVLGLDPSHLMGRPFWEIFHPDGRARLRGEAERSLLGTGSADFQARLLHADGSERQVHFHLKGAEGTKSRGFDSIPFLGVGRDTTAQKRLESQIMQFQKMEAVGTLAGGMAHDFNNLLTVILSHTEGATDALELGHTARTDLEQVRKAARRAAELTRQVLTFSRRHPVEPAELQLNEVVRELDVFLKRLLPPGFELEVETSEHLGWVMGDRSQMEQVIMNLVLNARDAMPKGGVIKVSTRNLTLTEPLSQGPNLLPAGPWVVVEVRDNGQGIPEAHLERIFEPFYTTKTVGQGTGLGLSVVYGIVRAHQGGLHVETEPGHGTTVRVFLPLVELAQGVGQAAPGGRHVLLLEGDEFNRKVLRRLLGLSGFLVTAVEDEAKARVAAQAEGLKYDLLVASRGSTSSGIEAFAKELSARHPALRTVTLLSSGEAPPPDGSPCLAPPYDVEQITALMTGLVTGA